MVLFPRIFSSRIIFGKEARNGLFGRPKRHSKDPFASSRLETLSLSYCESPALAV